jgi:hypothetical protein
VCHVACLTFASRPTVMLGIAFLPLLSTQTDEVYHHVLQKAPPPTGASAVVAATVVGSKVRDCMLTLQCSPRSCRVVPIPPHAGWWCTRGTLAAATWAFDGLQVVLTPETSGTAIYVTSAANAATNAVYASGVGLADNAVLYDGAARPLNIPAG